MKKILVLLLAAFMLIGTVAGCADDAAPAGGGDAAETTSGTLRIWSFTDEVERHEAIFRTMYPDVTIEYAITNLDDGAYEEWVLTALAAGGANVPDVIYLEAAIVRHFVEGPFLMDLSDMLPKAKALETYQFVLDIGTADGEVRAYSWQATPF